ncbi:MAG: hypothetical protein ABIP48_26320, partial [Planctomycetota bacterium]
HNVLFEDTENSYNNWRGEWGEYDSWSVGGTKFLVIIVRGRGQLADRTAASTYLGNEPRPEALGQIGVRSGPRFEGLMEQPS